VKSNFHREAAKSAKFFFYKNTLRVLCGFAVDFGFGCAAQRMEMARVDLRCPDTAAELTVDGAPSGKAQAKTRLSLRPGHHVFELRGADGSVQVREADLGPGDQVALDLGGAK